MDSSIHHPLLHEPHVAVGVDYIPSHVPVTEGGETARPLEGSPEERLRSNSGAVDEEGVKGKSTFKQASCAVKSISVCLLFGVVLGVIAAIALPPFVQTKIDANVKSNAVIDSSEANGFEQFYNHSHSADNCVKFYFFNITNTFGVLNGEKPQLVELGPFIYKQFQMRNNFTWSNDGEDTLSYTQHTWIEFDSEATSLATNGQFNSDDIQITSINLVFSGMKARVGLLLEHLASDIILFKDDYHRLFSTQTVKEYVLGYNVDIKILSFTYPIEFPGLMGNVPLSEDPQTLNKQTMYVGSKDSSKIYQLTKFVGKESVEMSCPWSESSILPQMNSCEGDYPCCNHPGKAELFPTWGTEIFPDVWDSDANLVQGTNGEQFHPNVQKTDKLVVFNDVASRAIQFENVNGEEVTVKGIKMYRFTPTMDFIQNAAELPSNARYYKFGPSGVINMTHLQQGADVHISYPHFLFGEASLHQGVEGLNPDPEKHRLVIDVEPNTGQTLQQHSRIQVNARIRTDAYGIDVFFPNLKNETYVPVAWFEINSLLSDDAADELKQIYMAKGIQSGAVYGGIGVAVISVAALSILAYRHFRQ